jgi:hypothetical protein
MVLFPPRKTVKEETSKEVAGESNKPLGALLERKMTMMIVA